MGLTILPEKGTVHQLKQTKLYLCGSNPDITVEQSEVMENDLKETFTFICIVLIVLLKSVLSK